MEKNVKVNLMILLQCDVDSVKAVFELNDPGLWPANLNDMEREIIVRYLANRDEDQQMQNDFEAKPLAEYLKWERNSQERLADIQQE